MPTLEIVEVSIEETAAAADDDVAAVGTAAVEPNNVNDDNKEETTLDAAAAAAAAATMNASTSAAEAPSKPNTTAAAAAAATTTTTTSTSTTKKKKKKNKRNITPMPASEKKPKKSKASSSSSEKGGGATAAAASNNNKHSSQLTLGAFFGTATSTAGQQPKEKTFLHQVTPLAATATTNKSKNKSHETPTAAAAAAAAAKDPSAKAAASKAACAESSPKLQQQQQQQQQSSKPVAVAVSASTCSKKTSSSSSSNTTTNNKNNTTTFASSSLDPARKSALLSIVVGKRSASAASESSNKTASAADNNQETVPAVQLLSKFDQTHDDDDDDDSGTAATQTKKKEQQPPVTMTTNTAATTTTTTTTQELGVENATNVVDRTGTAVAAATAAAAEESTTVPPAVTKTAPSKNAEDSTAIPCTVDTKSGAARKEAAAAASLSSLPPPQQQPRDSATAAAAAKKPHSSNNNIIDYARDTLKLSAGTRLEVQWQIENDDSNDDDDDDDDEPPTRWWGATLQEFDGRCTPDGRHAIRVLLYDAYPAGGFDEESREEVVFQSKRVLTSVHERTELAFRLEARSKQQCADESCAEESYSPKKVTTTRSSQSPSPVAAAAAKPLSETAKTWVEKKTKMHEAYMTRAKKLLEQCREKLPEEDVSIPLPSDAVVPDDASFDNFPDFAVQALVSLVEGTNEPLSVLAASATEKLNQLFYGTTNNKLTVEMTTSKIKIVATRKNLVKNPAIVDGSAASAALTKTLNVFEDTCADFMWRWEVAVLELLPNKSLTAIKKARSVRKKASSYLNAVIKLLQSLADSDKSLHNDAKLEKVIAKVSQEEERVLKYVREEEKQRLAKQKKEASKPQREEEQKENVKAKQLQDEEKKREKEQKKLEAAKEKQRKKEDAAKEKQRKKEEAAELKRQKELEKEAAERKEKAKKQALLEKQRKTMMSFFSAANTATKSPPSSKGTSKKLTSEAVDLAQGESQEPLKQNVEKANFDSKSFRSIINSSAEERPLQPVFSTLSSAARKSRRRRTKRVTVPVFVTVFPDNPFEMQPFAEQKDVSILNKYKFFLFHEDVRPPYHGTWSKCSKVVTGRNPFGKDVNCVDYEADSEAEWEEGDDEEGDDLESPDVLEEEEKDDEEASLNEDGWLADDDELVDEETKALHKKRLQAGGDAGKQLKEQTVCIVAPQEGRPPSFDSTGSVHPRVEGFSLVDAEQAMEKCSAESMKEEQIFLDAFPPMLIDEANGANDSSDAGKQVTEEDKKTFVKFVHNSTAKSKDKLIDALQEAHPSTISSRAQALRILDATAEKKKGPAGNVYWQVKPDVLSTLGLENLETVDTDEAHHEAMRKIAEAVHHATATSKDKAVDEIRRVNESLNSLSRAESVRLIEAVAEKKKHPTSGVYWEVKSDVRDKLGMSHLPLAPPSVQQAAASSPKGNALEKEPTKASPAATADKEVKLSDSASKKRKTSGPPAGSAKLLASFLKKQKLAGKP